MIRSILLALVAITIAAAEPRILTSADFDASEDGVFRLRDHYSGEVERLNDAGVLLWRGYFRDGLADGVFIAYGTDGSIRTCLCRRAGKLDGPYLIYGRDRVQVTYFRDGERIGGADMYAAIDVRRKPE